jgi:hypothetical protein
VLAGRPSAAEARLESCEPRLDPRSAPGTWGEFLRIRGAIHERADRGSRAHHDFAQSANVFDLLGERYQAAVSHLALARLAAHAGNRTAAERYLDQATTVFRILGAERDLVEVEGVKARLAQSAGVQAALTSADVVDEAVIRRLVEAAILPDLLARETATALLETIEADAAVVFVAPSGGEVRVSAAAGCDSEVARSLARAASQGSREYGEGWLITEPLGRDHDGPRSCTIVAGRRLTDGALRRLRMFASVARQGFELCGARERPSQAVEPLNERLLEPLLPGFICASAAMNRVAEQIQRLRVTI